MLYDHVSLQASTDTQLRKLEEMLCDANARNEELQKTVSEVTATKNRLTGDALLTLMPELHQHSKVWRQGEFF